ncbi:MULTISPECIES: cysteine--tRNA ligase [Pacificibacter]|uniref:cysteine--tRNA ligase n=1 Tax=Pacificibacter TaxID=1042323 RepID=UPI001C08F0D0|nr:MULTISPECIES: cysteine--tRNA ligase [Pacificibacter]MBU2936917.1 cysteine--tRNA ligase [Pacificibacter marinus]MDO6614911.1 cysteine--tRNA ligase [Pacificibacter sp. 1_MG-2023]
MTNANTDTVIRLTNTKTRKKEVFTPIDAQNVRMYVCGPTVYDRAHIGNARPVIVFDVLNRLLRHVYGADHVTYVRNFTDVDDKINAKAAETGRSIRDITDETTQWYLDDMQAVGAMDPDHMPRATEYIDQMITMIADLIAKGHAYADGAGHVLFSVNSYPHYGDLSGRNTDDMIAGARVEIADNKRDPMDFVLWKPSDADTPGWDSPWGKGRPGWHIECSAMAQDLLGETFDIHGGGNDLMFPHHENEIAQSCCASGHAEDGGGFANYWLHNEMLQVEGKKMSKSLGNFFTVRDLLDQGVSGDVIRFVFLSTHYRKPMDWTQEKADQARKTLEKWGAALTSVGIVLKNLDESDPDPEVVAALASDLNTPLAIARLHTLFKEAQSDERMLSVFKASLELLGLNQGNMSANRSFSNAMERIITPDLGKLESKLHALRASAMETKDFTPVDALKTALLDAGVEVRISKTGVELEAGPKFDASKLEGLL